MGHNIYHTFPAFCARFQEETIMKWTTPTIVEIAVGLEINAYACAELN
jgi:coenzyme PQQ precursor peptide PqqA